MSQRLIYIAILFGLGGLQFIFWPGFAERWAETQKQNNRSLFTTAAQIRAFGAALIVLAALMAWYGYLIR
jgi:hypothetical protein